MVPEQDGRELDVCRIVRFITYTCTTDRVEQILTRRIIKKRPRTEQKKKRSNRRVDFMVE